MRKAPGPVPEVGAQLVSLNDASVKGVAAKVYVKDNGHTWIDARGRRPAGRSIPRCA